MTNKPSKEHFKNIFVTAVNSRCLVIALLLVFIAYVIMVFIFTWFGFQTFRAPAYLSYVIAACIVVSILLFPHITQASMSFGYLFRRRKYELIPEAIKLDEAMQLFNCFSVSSKYTILKEYDLQVYEAQEDLKTRTADNVMGTALPEFYFRYFTENYLDSSNKRQRFFLNNKEFQHALNKMKANCGQEETEYIQQLLKENQALQEKVNNFEDIASIKLAVTDKIDELYKEIPRGREYDFALMCSGVELYKYCLEENEAYSTEMLKARVNKLQGDGRIIPIPEIGIIWFKDLLSDLNLAKRQRNNYFVNYIKKYPKNDMNHTAYIIREVIR